MLASEALLAEKLIAEGSIRSLLVGNPGVVNCGLWKQATTD